MAENKAIETELQRRKGLLKSVQDQVAVETELKRGKTLMPLNKKFSEDQPRDESGRWTSGGGGGDSKPEPVKWKQPVDKNGRPIPIKVKTVFEAARLVHEGKVVEVPRTKDVVTLIERLGYLAQQAKEAGKEAKTFDLCQISVADTNMFCAESLRSAEFPEGVPRIKMPQLGGQPVPGSEADKLPRNPWDKTEVDGSEAFRKYLTGELKLGVTSEKIEASALKASQAELIGPKVAKMMNDASFDPAKNPIFISRDNYVIDGHHRWAAVAGRDAQDNKFGDIKMNAFRIDAPISEVLHIANKWSEKFGIKPAGFKSRLMVSITRK